MHRALDQSAPLGKLFGRGDGRPNRSREARLRQLLAEAGFAQVRLAVDAPFNLVFEVRP